jgi:hypothetical protein
VAAIGAVLGIAGGRRDQAGAQDGEPERGHSQQSPHVESPSLQLAMSPESRTSLSGGQNISGHQGKRRPALTLLGKLEE